jgi:protease-4
MKRALEVAAELAELEDYRLFERPAQKDPFKELIEELSGNVKTRIIKSELGDNYQIYQYLKEVQEMEGIQARLPYNVKIR